MKLFKEFREDYLLEVLKSTDPTSKWISDFVNSDDPKFKGKSKKERIRMALGAKYATMRKESFHYCAKHVYSDIFGEGIVIEGEHAEPNSLGNIEWYTVKFNHGNEIVFTEDLDVLIAEYHKNHKKKQKKTDIKETLHPNQKKLDVAYPKNKLTADDFAKLRAMKKRK